MDHYIDHDHDKNKRTDRRTEAITLPPSLMRPVTRRIRSLAIWCSGGVVGPINEVALHRTRLVLGWVTVFGRAIHLGVEPATRSTQPCIPPGWLNRVAASAGVKVGMSPLSGGR